MEGYSFITNHYGVDRCIRHSDYVSNRRSILASKQLDAITAVDAYCMMDLHSLLRFAFHAESLIPILGGQLVR